MVARDFPWVILIANRLNLGFTRGNNQALARSRGRYLLLLNPDTEVVGDAIGVMIDYLEENRRVGVVGPKLLQGDGSVQSSRRRFPTVLTAFVESTILQRYLPHSRILRRYYMSDTPDDAIQEVDWLVGACLLVRREAVAQAGLLDERFFMYSEELDWCHRIKDHGWAVVYLPTAQVIHHEARSSEQALAVQHIHFHASKVAYFHKYHGRLVAETLRLFLLMTYVVQLVEEGVKWLLGHKRWLRAQRLVVYVRVLRSGLREGPHHLTGSPHPL